MGLRAGETWRERVRLGTAGRLATIGPDKICTFKSAIYMVRDLLINSPVRQHRAYLASTPNSRNAWVRTQQEGSNAVFTMDLPWKVFLVLETFHKKLVKL